MLLCNNRAGYHFNPRSPRGGATITLLFTHDFMSISIHAPREGERRSGAGDTGRPRYISIHAPREGERRRPERISGLKKRISIHAPREGERHQGQDCAGRQANYFNPRSPRGGATGAMRNARARTRFQSTLPARGSDVFGCGRTAV